MVSRCEKIIKKTNPYTEPRNKAAAHCLAEHLTIICSDEEPSNSLSEASNADIHSLQLGYLSICAASLCSLEYWIGRTSIPMPILSTL